MKRSIGTFLASTVLGAMVASPILNATAGPALEIPDVSGLAVSGAQGHSKVDRSRFPSSGSVDIVVQLSEAPLALANGENSHRLGGVMNRNGHIAHSAKVHETAGRIAQQDRRTRREPRSGRVRIAYNAAIVRVDASKLEAVAALPGVMTVRPVGEYKLSLNETVPYVGAAAVHAAGTDGAGVVVAVLDSASTTRIAISAVRERRLRMTRLTAPAATTRRTRRATACSRRRR